MAVSSNLTSRDFKIWRQKTGLATNRLLFRSERQFPTLVLLGTIRVFDGISTRDFPNKLGPAP